MNKKIAIVDIDNTLWNLSEMLYKELKKINNNVEPPDKWYTWNFYLKYKISYTEFYKIVSKIHFDQDKYMPYESSKWFLNELKDKYYIIITSYRNKSTYDVTKKFLDKNNLYYDEIFLSYDKRILFNRCNLVIDDSPIILTESLIHNIPSYGLKFKWNECLGNDVVKNTHYDIIKEIYNI